MKKKSKRKKSWQYGYNDPWIRILEILSKMAPEERARCIRATAECYRGR